MKLKLLLVALCGLILVSCSKEKRVVIRSYPSVQSELAGAWTWLYTSGGFAGGMSTPATTGETRKIEFTCDNILRYYLNGDLKSEIQITIEKGVSVLSHDSVYFVEKTEGWRQSIKFRSSDTLLLSDEVFDGYENCYLRIK
jgi:hypothetical protein